MYETKNNVQEILNDMKNGGKQVFILDESDNFIIISFSQKEKIVSLGYAVVFSNLLKEQITKMQEILKASNEKDQHGFYKIVENANKTIYSYNQTVILSAEKISTNADLAKILDDGLLHIKSSMFDIICAINQ